MSRYTIKSPMDMDYLGPMHTVFFNTMNRFTYFYDVFMLLKLLDSQFRIIPSKFNTLKVHDMTF